MNTVCIDCPMFDTAECIDCTARKGDEREAENRYWEDYDHEEDDGGDE